MYLTRIAYVVSHFADVIQDVEEHRQRQLIYTTKNDRWSVTLLSVTWTYIHKPGVIWVLNQFHLSYHSSWFVVSIWPRRISANHLLPEIVSSKADNNVAYPFGWCRADFSMALPRSCCVDKLFILSWSFKPIISSCNRKSETVSLGRLFANKEKFFMMAVPSFVLRACSEKESTNLIIATVCKTCTSQSIHDDMIAS